jgi:hypothetical protein
MHLSSQKNGYVGVRQDLILSNKARQQSEWNLASEPCSRNGVKEERAYHPATLSLQPLSFARRGSHTEATWPTPLLFWARRARTPRREVLP